MSTRAQITIDGEDGGMFELSVYKHSDGYPEGVLPFLRQFVAEFHKYRRHDPSYFIAQLLRHWAVYDHLKGLTLGGMPLSRPECSEGHYKQFQYLSWGIETQLHVDLEFIYHVTKDGTIEVRKPIHENTPFGVWDMKRAATLDDTRVVQRWLVGNDKPSRPSRRKVKAMTRQPDSELA